MQTKAYFASSVPAALEVARQELGENALLVSSRPAPPQARQFGRLEVTFAWDPTELPPPPLVRSRLEPRRAAAMSPAAAEMDEIRGQLAALRVAGGRGGSAPNAKIATEHSLMAERLATAGFSPEMAVDIAAGGARRSGNPDIAIVTELTSRIPTAPVVGMQSGEGRTLAFIGPPGRGKTISLVKIAVNMGLARRVPVRICCAGAHPIGAQEQVARLAAILGAPFQACESLAGLNLALNGEGLKGLTEGWKGLTLIDTPGISPADRDELSELKDFFATRPEIEKHLVLRADASSADMLHMVSRFSVLAPSRLLFTGMDEAIGTVSVVETLMRAGIPATFAGTGQQIPQDLEEVNAGRLARAVWASAGGAAATTDEKLVQAAAA
jgi:flagellar biosynthesis GTPase FlhF